LGDVLKPLRKTDPVTTKLPETLTFLVLSTLNIVTGDVLPEETENKFVLVPVSDILSISPPLPDTDNTVEPLPLSCKAILPVEADINELPVTLKSLRLPESVNNVGICYLFINI
jgi:hypothetical protein